MTDDFMLFPVAAAGEAEIDADIALITAYLARELSPVQVRAVRERLAADQQFRDRVSPLIEGWTIPGSLAADTSATHARAAGSSLTLAEIDTAWGRYRDERRAPPQVQLATAVSVGRAASPEPTRRRSMARIAAQIALIILPAIAFAQWISYAAARPGTPGHGMAMALLAPFGDAPSTPAAATRPDLLAMASDSGERPQPVPLTLAERARQIGQPRPLGLVVAASDASFGDVQQVIPLRDGRLLINDAGRRRLVVVDSAFRRPTVVIDSTTWGMSYHRTAHSRLGFHYPAVTPFEGDSLLFPLHPAAFVVLDPALKPGRTIGSTPVGGVAPNAASPYPIVPPQRWARGMGLLDASAREVVACAIVTSIEARCDGSLTAFDPERRTLDTIARYYLPLVAAGFASTTDRWVVMNDGTIALLRAREHRIDWIGPDRAVTSGPPIPHPWRTLDLTERTRMADSINADSTQRYESRLAAWKLDSADVVNGRPWNPRIPLMHEEDPGAAIAQAIAAFTRLGTKIPPGWSQAPMKNQVTATEIRGSRGTERRPRPPRVIPPEDFPERIPPTDRLFIPTLLADLDNRLWIRWGIWVTPPGSPPIYDIVNRAGELVDRVRIPVGRTIVGFGEGGIVYLASQGGGTSRIEKVMVR